MYSMSRPCMGQRCSPCVCMACAESQAAVCSISTELRLKACLPAVDSDRRELHMELLNIAWPSVLASKAQCS